MNLCNNVADEGLRSRNILQTVHQFIDSATYLLTIVSSFTNSIAMSLYEIACIIIYLLVRISCYALGRGS